MILGTEKAVGHAIRASGIPRTDIFVTTKLPWHHASRVEESINDSLQNAGLQYFDLVSETEQYL
jgi:glycerol 2-dehydrogenase (NADP+)